MIQLIKISGKARQVFAILELVTQKQGQMKLGELENWIAGTIKERLTNAGK